MVCTVLCLAHIGPIASADAPDSSIIELRIMETTDLHMNLLSYDYYKGADSIELLKEVGNILKKEGYKVGNIDSTIIAQRPKLMTFLPEMRKNVAAALGIDVNQVSIKATTEEHLGFTGRGEGISSQAVALIENL